MKKNRIRLTESQLHKVIKESVTKILSELDWKTYRNAAQKAAERDEYDRAYDFKDAAIDSFNDEYGYTSPSGRYDVSMGRFTSEPLGRDRNIDPYALDSNLIDDSDVGRDFNTYPEINDAFDALDRATNEYDNYVKDKYEYEPNGRGWHLKDKMDESIRRAIRKVLY